MNYRSKLIEDTKLQFKCNVPVEIGAIYMKFISEFHVEYLFLIDSSGNNIDEVSSDVEDILHDILTNMGVRKDESGNVVGFKYNIEYNFFESRKELDERLAGADFICIYPL